jgi:hypothetical protein
MPWIPFYADDEDFLGIVEHLNQDDEVAFVVSAGPTSWKAVPQVNFHHLHEETILWHIKGGPLPLWNDAREIRFIKDPFSGWEDHCPSDLSYRKNPYFGAGCPVTIDLKINTSGRHDPEAIGISSFGWIGNRYSVIGNPAPTVTKEWWEKLRKWVSKNSRKKISRAGPIGTGKGEIYSFSRAYEKFLAGADREENS